MGTAGGDLCQRPRCWYYRQGFGLLATKDGQALVPDGENRYHAIFGGRPGLLRERVEPWASAGGARARRSSWLPPKAIRDVPAAKFFVTPQGRAIPARSRYCPDEILTEILIPAGARKTATYEVRQKEALDWPLATASVALKMNGNTVASAQHRIGTRGPDSLGSRRSGESAGRQNHHRRRPPRRPAKPPWKAPNRSARTPTRCNWRKSP